MTECSIGNGALVLRLLDSDGNAMPRDEFSGGPAPIPAKLTVRPGDLIFGDVLWSLRTAPAPQPTSLALYPGGDTGNTADAIIISIADIALPTRAQQPTTRTARRPQASWYVNRVAEPGTLGVLTAAIAVPTTVEAGQVLSYTITLTNPTAQPVPLSPCPDFAHLLEGKSPAEKPGGGSRGTLNCHEAPAAVGPLHTLSLDFEYDTTGRPPGRAWLIWHLFEGAIPAVSAQASLTITP